MLLRPPTNKQLAATFDRVLTKILAGDLAGCPTDTGLDDLTIATLNRIASSADKAAAADHARQMFAMAGKAGKG